VTLDGIDNGLLIFQAIAYVPGPRMAAGVRSELLFTILERLQASQVPMAVASPASVPGAMGPSLAPAAPLRPSLAAVRHCHGLIAVAVQASFKREYLNSQLHTRLSLRTARCGSAS
jgi:hypothetical protein